MATDPVTALEISLGTALLPRPLERYVNKAGKPVSLAAPSAGNPSYLWIARAPDGAPIVDIKVLYDEEEAPEGYKRTRDASGGVAAKVFIVYKTGSAAAGAEKPIVGLTLVCEGEAPDAGYTLIDRSLTRESAPIRLAIQHASDTSAEAPSAWAEGLKAGDLVDFMDKQRRWRVARIAAVSPDSATLTIAPKGWPEKYNENLPRNSKRLAKPGQYTAGQDTRDKVKQGEVFEVDLEALRQMEMRIDDYIAGDFPLEEREVWAKGELPEYLEKCLSSKYESEEMQERINSFNQKVQELIVFHLKKADEPLPPEVRQHLARMALADPNCNFFFEMHGAILPSDAKAEATNGWAARLPLPRGASRFYVMCVNNFWRLGGYDAILNRLRAQNDAARAALARGSSATAAATTTAASASTGGGGAAGGDAAAATTPQAASTIDDDLVLELLVCSNVVFVPRFCYTMDWAKKYYQPLRDALFDRFMTMSEGQLKKAANKNIIEGVKKDMDNLIRAIWERADDSSLKEAILAGPEGACKEDRDHRQAVERWQIALALRLLRSDALNMRVKALSDIREIVEAVDPQVSSRQAAVRRAANTYNMGYYNSTPDFSKAVWFDVPRLAKWLMDNRVVDIVLGQPVPIVAGGSTDAKDAPLCPVRSQTVSRLTTIIEFLCRTEYQLEMSKIQVRPIAQVVPAGRAKLLKAVPVDSELRPVAEPAAPAPAPSPTADSSTEEGAAPTETTPTPPVGGGAAATDAAAAGTAGAAEVASKRAIIDTFSSRQALPAITVDLLVKLLAEEPEDELQKCVLDILTTIAPNRTVDQLQYIYGKLAALVSAQVAASRAGGAASGGSKSSSKTLLRAPLIDAIRSISRNAFEQVLTEREQEEAGVSKAAELKALTTALAVRTAAAAAGEDAEAAFQSAISEARIAASDDICERWRELDATIGATPDWATSASAPVSAWWGIKSLWEIIMGCDTDAGAGSADDAGAASEASSSASASSSGVPSIVSLASDALVALLKDFSRHRQLDAVLSACFANIAAGTSVLTNLRLVDALLRIVPLQANEIHSDFWAERTIARLNAKYNLPSLLIGELKGYKAKALAAARARGISPGSAQEEGLVLVGSRSHIENVSTRLNLYMYVLQNGELELSLDALTDIWTALVDNATTAGEAEAFFSWLQNARSPVGAASAVTRMASQRLFPAPLTTAIFSHLFADATHFSTASIGPNAFAAFESFFRASNAFAGHIVEESLTAWHAVDCGALLGMDVLWACGLRAADASVSREALQLLISIHANVQPPVAEDEGAGGRLAVIGKKKDAWLEFVNRCMGILAENVAAINAAASATATAGSSSPRASASGSVRTVAKVLRLLSTFLETVEASASSSSAAAPQKAVVIKPTTGQNTIFAEGPQLMPPQHMDYKGVMVYAKEAAQGTGGAVNVQARSHVETLGCLRSRLSEAFNVPIDRIVFTVLGSGANGRNVEIIPAEKDADTVAKANFAYGFNAIFLPKATPMTVANVYLSPAERFALQKRNSLRLRGTPVDEIEGVLAAEEEASKAEAEVARVPRGSLSNDANFDQLFALLSLHNATIVSDAWGLLQTLPVNPKVQADIHTLQGLVHAADAAAPPAGFRPDWDAILDGSAPLKLLYSLQIMSKHMDWIEGAAVAAAADVPTAVLSSTWGRAFIASGGVAHLQKLLLTVNFNELIGAAAGQLPKECARLLFSACVRFLVADASNLRSYKAAGAPLFTADRVALASRLLSLISIATQQAAPRGGAAEESAGEALTEGSADDKKGEGKGAKWFSADLDDQDMGVSSLYSADQAQFWDYDDEYGSNKKGKKGDKGNNNADAKPAAPKPEAAIIVLITRLLRAALLGKDAVTTLAPEAVTTEVSEAPADAALCAALADAFVSAPGFGDAITLALVSPKDQSVRSAVSAGLESLAIEWKNSAFHASAAAAKPSAAFAIASALLERIEVPYAFPDTCPQFFDLLGACVRLLPRDAAAPEASLCSKEILTKLATLIRTHPVVEVGQDLTDVTDEVLKGLMATVQAILTGRAHLKEFAGTAAHLDLVEEIFERCLFAMPSDDSPTTGAGGSAVPSVLGARLPKCKKQVTRQQAFDLLQEMATDCAAIGQLLCDKILPHHDLEAAAAVAAKGGLVRSSSTSKGDDDALEGYGVRGGRRGGAAAANKEAEDSADKDKAAISLSNRSRTMGQPRNSTGYVGLVNLGCICYMNSTIQQFFMNPDFRRGVLSWQEPRASTAADKRDSILFQLQRQFAHLQESEKAAFVPRGLCYSIKDWEGNPTNIGEQKDVPEFLTKLFADMETQAQGTAIANLPKQVFGGTALQEIIADDPRGQGRKRLYNTRDDEFYFLQVRVKGNRTLQDALADYVSGETVDYKWDVPVEATPAVADAAAPGGGASAPAPAPAAKPAEQTLKTIKRTSLKTLGDHLMVHLNRFSFNYETMQQEKLNDRFEFPRFLDMYPYTVHGRPDAILDAGATPAPEDRSQFMFELVGVVIHMGTAVGGHYFSYIRERDEEGPGERWYEFNDSHVSPWDATDRAFDNDCFGGIETRTSGGSTYTSYVNGVAKVVTNPPSTFEYAKTTNAFVLYYDRVKAKPASTATATASTAATTDASTGGAAAVPLSGGAASSSASTASAASTSLALPANPRDLFASRIQGTGKKGTVSLARHRARCPVPKDLLDSIIEENTDFVRLRNIFDLPYFAFCRQLLKSVANVTAPPPSPFPVAADYSVPYPVGGLLSTKHALAVGGPAVHAVRMGAAFILNTLTDSSQQATLPEWNGAMKQLFSNNGVAAAWFLSSLVSDVGALKRMLFVDSTASGAFQREFLVILIGYAVAKVWETEKDIDPAAAPADPAADAAAVAAGGKPFTGVVPGRLVRTLIGILADQLSIIHNYWRQFDSYFNLLTTLANMDGTLRGVLASFGLLGRLIDFALEGDSPHPEVNDAAAASSPAVGGAGSKSKAIRRLGDGYNYANLEPIFGLVRTLATSYLPPSGLAGSPTSTPPQAALSPVEADLLTCRQMIANLASQCKGWRISRAYRPLLTHLYWGCAPTAAGEAPAAEGDAAAAADYGFANLMTLTCNIIRLSIKAYDAGAGKSYIVFAGNLMDIAGDTPAGAADPNALQKARIDALARAILAGLFAGRRFFSATEFGIERFVKLAKTRPLLRQWMSANADVWAWCDQWFTDFPRAPPAACQTVYQRDDGASMRVYKAQQAYNVYQNTQHGLPNRDPCTHNNIKLLLAGEPVEWDYAESDDEPSAIVGRRVRLALTNMRKLDGNVSAWDPEKQQHRLECADGTIQYSNLCAHKYGEHDLIYSTDYEARVKALYATPEGTGATAAADPAASAATGADELDDAPVVVNPRVAHASQVGGGRAGDAASDGGAEAGSDDDDNFHVRSALQERGGGEVIEEINTDEIDGDDRDDDYDDDDDDVMANPGVPGDNK